MAVRSSQSTWLVEGEQLLGPSNEVVNSLPLRLTTRPYPELKVFGAVVISHAIDVMDVFGRKKRSTQHRRHHEFVLKDVPTLLSIGMSRNKNTGVTQPVQPTQTLATLDFPPAQSMGVMRRAESSGVMSVLTPGDRAASRFSGLPDRAKGDPHAQLHGVCPTEALAVNNSIAAFKAANASSSRFEGQGFDSGQTSSFPKPVVVIAQPPGHAVPFTAIDDACQAHVSMLTERG